MDSSDSPLFGSPSYLQSKFTILIGSNTTIVKYLLALAMGVSFVIFMSGANLECALKNQETFERREMELRQTCNMTIERLEQRETDLNRTFSTAMEELRGEINGTVEGSKQREAELSNTFSATIEGLRLQIQQLESEKAAATQSRSTVDVAHELATALRKDPTDSTGCHSYGNESIHDSWFQWEFGLGYNTFSKEETLSCFDKLPGKHVVFAGDSLLRNVYARLLHKMDAPKSHFEDLHKGWDWGHRLEEIHFHTEGTTKMDFMFVTESKSMLKQFQTFPDTLTGDVMFLGTGAWELAFNTEPNTLFMMSYIAGLSATIKFLQENFKGRVIFTMAPPTSHTTLSEKSYRGTRWNSKLQALNRFSTKLVTGAGFEVLNLYDFLSTGEGGFIPYGDLTRDGFHPRDQFNDMALNVYTNEICRGSVFDSSTPAKLTKFTENFTRHGGCRL